MNALDDAASVTPGDADRPTPVGPTLLLPAEDKVRSAFRCLSVKLDNV